MHKTIRQMVLAAVLWRAGSLAPNAFAGIEPVSAILPEAIGKSGSGDSLGPILSPDGRFALFVSEAQDLVPASFDAFAVQVFLRDLAAGTTTLVSLSNDGAEAANDDALYGGMTPDGQWVVFQSAATNLVDDDQNDLADIFLRDLKNGSTQLVSRSLDGAGSGAGPSTSPEISPDGRFVLFESSADNLVGNDTNRSNDIFLWNRESGKTELVSVGIGDRSPDGYSDDPSMTPDGRFVVFRSAGANLVVNGLANNAGDIFLRDMAAGKTFWVSTNASKLVSAGALGAQCFAPAISSDGRWALFYATGALVTALLRHDTQTGVTEKVVTETPSAKLTINSQSLIAMTPDARLVADGLSTNVYVWNAETKAAVLVNTALGASNETPSNGVSHSPALSADGRYVTFLSTSSELVTNRVTGTTQLYRKDLATGEIRLVSHNAAAEGVLGDDIDFVTMSADGRKIAFDSAAGDLAPADLNEAADAFVWNVENDSLSLISERNSSLLSVTGSGESLLGSGSLSANGQRIVFKSMAFDLAPNDSNESYDIFLRDLASGKTTLLSRAFANGAGGAGDSLNPAISGDGKFVVFSSRAANLVPGDTNKAEDVFLWSVEDSTLQAVSVNLANSGAGNKASTQPVISADGRYVAFQTLATNLVPDDNVNFSDIVVRDTLLGTNILVSARIKGLAESGGDSIAPSISPDGHYVFFVSKAGDIVNPALSPGINRGFVRDLWANKTTLVSPHDDTPNFKCRFSGDSQWLCHRSSTNLYLANLARGTNVLIGPGALPDISFDGRFVAYESNERFGREYRTQISLFDRDTGQTAVISRNPLTGGTGNSSSSSPSISGDGRRVVFESHATDLVAGDNNSFSDIFLYHRETDQITLVSRKKSSNEPGNFLSANAFISMDGKTVAFQSYADDLIDGDLNQLSDVFAYREEILDSDHDGLPDAWELAVFGNLDPTGEADADADGQSNLQEFKAGTDPKDKNSLLSLAAVEFTTDGQPRISWKSVAGRLYKPQYKNALEENLWTDPGVEVRAAGLFASWTDSSAPLSATRFYRIVLQE